MTKPNATAPTARIAASTSSSPTVKLVPSRRYSVAYGVTLATMPCSAASRLFDPYIGANRTLVFLGSRDAGLAGEQRLVRKA